MIAVDSKTWLLMIRVPEIYIFLAKGKNKGQGAMQGPGWFSIGDQSGDVLYYAKPLLQLGQRAGK